MLAPSHLPGIARGQLAGLASISTPAPVQACQLPISFQYMCPATRPENWLLALWLGPEESAVGCPPPWSWSATSRSAARGLRRTKTIDEEILERTLNWIDRQHQAGTAVEQDQAGGASSAGTFSLDRSAEWPEQPRAVSCSPFPPPTYTSRYILAQPPYSEHWKVMRITVMMSIWPPVSSVVGHRWAMRPCGERVKSRRRLRR
jgi:hypothetical protein